MPLRVALALRSATDFHQEAANSDFLLEHGAAAKANRVEDLPYRVEQLLGSKKLSEMGKAAKSWAGRTRRKLSAVKCCRA